MPKVAYSEEDRERIRTELVAVGLELMAKQGIQHTTVEQIYKKVGISRTFFYSFFATILQIFFFLRFREDQAYLFHTVFIHCLDDQFDSILRCDALTRLWKMIQ